MRLKKYIFIFLIHPSSSCSKHYTYENQHILCLDLKCYPAHCVEQPIKYCQGEWLWKSTVHYHSTILHAVSVTAVLWLVKVNKEIHWHLWKAELLLWTEVLTHRCLQDLKLRRWDAAIHECCRPQGETNPDVSVSQLMQRNLWKNKMLQNYKGLWNQALWFWVFSRPGYTVPWHYQKYNRGKKFTWDNSTCE